MKETNDFMKSISLNTILYWIKKEKNPVKKKAFEIIKALKLDYSKKDMDEVLRVIDDSSLLFENSFKLLELIRLKKKLLSFLIFSNSIKLLILNSLATFSR